MGAAVDVLKVSDLVQISLLLRVLCVLADHERPPMGAAVDVLIGSDSAQISLLLRASQPSRQTASLIGQLACSVPASQPAT